ncbi:MAG TPA: amidohydrolase family protein, partial [Chthoniobacterales bacterium]
MVQAIDVHTHVVPHHISARASSSKFWPSIALDQDGSGDASVLIDGKVFRRIDSRCWDVPRRLADMREDNVDVHVLSPMPELLSHWLPAEEAEVLADLMNGHIARMIAEAPDQFVGLGMICMQDVNRAVAQLRKLRDLGLRGFEIGTHIDGTSLGSETLFAIYEAAADLD